MAKTKKIKTVEQRKRTVKESMKMLGTYKTEFDTTIQMYCELWEQYDIFSDKLRANDFIYECETTSGMKKAPIISTLETLRKDLLAYANSLGLTPVGIKKLSGEAVEKKAATRSPLDVILNE